MQKKWEVHIAGERIRKNFFGKEVKERHQAWPWQVMAENEDEAIKKVKQLWYNTNTTFDGYPVVVYSPESWDDWTIEKAIKYLKGKEFAEWAKQQGLIHFFERKE